MLSKITVSPGPHVSKAHSTRSVMLDVIIGLVPAMVAALFYFRHYAAIVMVTSVVSCVAVEWVCCKVMKRENSIGDLSAVVTGLLLAFSLPPAIPWWVILVGAIFGIGVTKMAFGGLGGNVFNPAMASRAFLTVSFGMLMSTWTVPVTVVPAMPEIGSENATAVTQATPLAWAKQAVRGEADMEVLKGQVADAFFGRTGGCLGETSALAMLIGGAYLLLRRTITFHVPLAILLAVVVFSEAAYLMGQPVDALYHVLTGGMLLCIFFIATDPVTMPLTRKGMWIFGAGVGLLIMLIRVVGEYPEGVMYAILIMNAVSPLIERWCKLVPFGGAPKNA